VALPVVGAELHLGVDAIAHAAAFVLLTGLVAVDQRERSGRLSDSGNDYPIPGTGSPLDIPQASTPR
jgi:hypothetical protein